MTIAQFKLAQAAATLLVAPMLFCVFNTVFDGRPHITEFEAGGIFAVALVRLFEAYDAADRTTDLQ